MRILLINDHIHFCGGGDAVFRLEREGYERAGFAVHTFSHAPQNPTEAGPRDVVEIESTSALVRKMGKFIAAPHVSHSLRSTLQSIRPDLVRVHLVSKYPASILPELLGYRVIMTLHGPNLFCATSWGNLKADSLECELGIGLKCWTRRCMPLSNTLLYTQLFARLRTSLTSGDFLFHCPSRHIQEKIEGLKFGPSFQMPLGIDQIFMDCEPAKHDGRPTIVYAGALIDAKGVLLLPDALQRIRQQIPDVKLVVCGTGVAAERLRTEFVNRNLMDHVDLRGFVGREEIVREYRKAHVLLVPSIWSEQFGLVGPEALACGVPCVGSRVGGIPEWLLDGEHGFLVPPGDSGALARRTVDLLKDREMRLRMSYAGRQYARRVHDPETYKRRWLEIANTRLRSEPCGVLN